MVKAMAGGAPDYVVEGVTGTFFTGQTAESLITVLQKFPSKKFNHQTIALRAKQFSTKQFREKFTFPRYSVEK